MDGEINEQNIKDLVSLTEASIPAMKSNWSEHYQEGYKARIYGKERKTHARRGGARGMWFHGYDSADEYLKNKHGR